MAYLIHVECERPNGDPNHTLRMIEELNCFSVQREIS